MGVGVRTDAFAKGKDTRQGGLKHGSGSSTLVLLPLPECQCSERMRRGSLALAPHSPHELLDLAAGVDQSLLAREERMALRADVEAKLFLGRMRLPGIAARAAHGCLDVLGMNIGTHVS